MCIRDRADILRSTTKNFSQEEVQHMCASIVKSGGKGIVFALDGLDDYRPKETKDNFIFKLIRGEQLQYSVVIVASRPAASQQIRKYASKHIEVLGFLREQIYEYIDSYYDNKPNQAQGLKTYLEQHPNVSHMCYLPIHIAMVTSLYEDNFPQTETEIYRHFTLP